MRDVVGEIEEVSTKFRRYFDFFQMVFFSLLLIFSFPFFPSGSLKDYQLEKELQDYERAVGLRRQLYEHLLQKDLSLIPYQHFDYGKVFGANCEIVIGELVYMCFVVFWGTVLLDKPTLAA